MSEITLTRLDRVDISTELVSRPPGSPSCRVSCCRTHGCLMLRFRMSFVISSNVLDVVGGYFCQNNLLKTTFYRENIPLGGKIRKIKVRDQVVIFGVWRYHSVYRLMLINR